MGETVETVFPFAGHPHPAKVEDEDEAERRERSKKQKAESRKQKSEGGKLSPCGVGPSGLNCRCEESKAHFISRRLLPRGQSVR